MILRAKSRSSSQSGKSWYRHGCRNLRAGRETVQGAAGQGGDDVRAADGEGEVGVTV